MKSDIQVVNGLVPVPYQDKLSALLRAKEFPWTFIESANGTYIANEQVPPGHHEHVQMSHYFNNSGVTSRFYDAVRPLVLASCKAFDLDEKRIVRCKANLNLNTYKAPPGEPQFGLPHPDFAKAFGNHKSVLYYVEDSPSGTAFYDQLCDHNLMPAELTGKEVLHAFKGRAVCFDSARIHAAGLVPDLTPRFVINMIFKV